MAQLVKCQTCKLVYYNTEGGCVRCARREGALEEERTRHDIAVTVFCSNCRLPIEMTQREAQRAARRMFRDRQVTWEHRSESGEPICPAGETARRVVVHIIHPRGVREVMTQDNTRSLPPDD